MPDPALSAAIVEAYASAPDGLVILDALEVWHPAFTMALRVVNDGAALDARLEADAPREAGQVVTFIPLAFRLRPPEAGPEAPGTLELEIDTAGREIVAEIDRAVADPAPVALIWRRFIAAEALAGPDLAVRGLVLRRVSATPLQMSSEAGWQDLVNERWPRLVYDRARFPTLEAGL